MTKREQLKGNNGTYDVELRAFAYGRASVLFAGTDSKGNTVCVKLFPKLRGMRSRTAMAFTKELTAQRRLNHLHILPIIDFGFDQQTLVTTEAPFIVLPMCRGGDLREMLRGRAFMPPNEALPLLGKIASAIDHAHASGFLHGDIKPENVLIGDSLEEVFLSDFGMSKYFNIAADFSSAKIGSSSSGGGSTAYLSPEQLQDGTQTLLSDIYSFTIMAYEMLTGRLPFDVTLSTYRQMEAKINGHLTPPEQANPSLSKTICQALQCGLQVLPSNRPVTASTLYNMMFDSASSKNSQDRKRSASSRKGGTKTTRSNHNKNFKRKHVFISYSHVDEKWLKEIRIYLKSLEDTGMVDFWDDRRIEPGSERRKEMQVAIARARVALLLISADYLGSDYIVRQELPSLLLKTQTEGAVLLQLFVSPCNIDNFEALTKFQSINGSQKTLAEMRKSDRQRTLVRLAEIIRSAIGIG